MKRNLLSWALLLISAAALYFFENNTGTRIVLLCAALFPLGFLPPDRPFHKKRKGTQKELRPDSAARPTGGAAGGSLREYVPGDPIRRIHWKLSAKTGRLLLRQEEPDEETFAGAQAKPVSRPAADAQDVAQARRGWAKRFALLFAVSLLLLFLLPPARRGAAELCNRLFAKSEARGAYRYSRFAVPPGQSVRLAAVLLAMAAFAWAAFAVFSPGRWPGCVTALALSLFQVYYGVCFPAFANVLLFAAVGVLLLPRPISRKGALRLGLSALLIALGTAVFLPGVDERLEALSERVRDRVSLAAGLADQTIPEEAAGEMETRHTHSRSLLYGEEEARSFRSFRLLTQQEKQISLPHFVDWLKIVLLLILTVALVALPFLPFAVLNERRKQTARKRAAFEQENVPQAVAAMFCHTAAWLRCFQMDGGNRLFVEWPAVLKDRFPEEYVQRFARCARLFEEAAYSCHPMDETAREEVRALLRETETALQARANRRQRFRLRYVECLCE